LEHPANGHGAIFERRCCCSHGFSPSVEALTAATSRNSCPEVFASCAGPKCSYPSKEEGRTISAADQAAAGSADRFSQAYQALRADSSLQVTLTPPPQPAKPPPWVEAILRWIGHALEPVGRFLRWIGSLLPDAAYARILLWVVIALGAAALLWALYNRIRYGEWRLRLPRRGSVAEAESEGDWSPDEAGVRSWLEEADALARDGRFAEAIHHLLFRSVDDISERRPALVRPALTSRELASSTSIPARARDLFASIAGLVERSLFGGRPVGEGDWRAARQAYSDFALPAAWRP
jgi:hypothetical protein